MILSRITSFLKLPKNQRFEYLPVMYDPVEDELEERRKMIQYEASETDLKDRMSTGFKHARRRTQNNSGYGSQRSRVFVIAVVLCMIVWLLFKFL